MEGSNQSLGSMASSQPAIPTVNRGPLGPKDSRTDLRPQPIPITPARYSHQASLAASPSRLRSSSPRLHSPASSEIFERNVQEPIPISTLSGELSPAHIPTHVITEDSIPPALEASAQAITSHSLNPDDVEIVTSATHQPAAASVLESTGAGAEYYPPLSPVHLRADEPSDLPPAGLHHTSSSLSAEEDGASNYAQLDPNDVRRLSFISFKDIVQSEQQQRDASHLHEAGSRDSLNLGFPPSASLQHDRAASPLRSPLSPASTASRASLSAGITTPPAIPTANPLFVTADQSPVRGLASPGSVAPTLHGELSIETMRQALRKTASGDLGGVRSAGMSPVSDDHFFRDPPRSRTNF